MKVKQVYQACRRKAVAGLDRGGRSLAALGQWLAPPRCLLCGSADCAVGVDLCGQCIRDLPAATGMAARIAPLASMYCPWHYDYPVDRLIRALKFHGDRSVARALGGLLAQWRAARPEPLPDLLLPVPLHADRLRQRGYNQADEIARYAAARLHLRRMPLALERIRDTPAQSGLSATQRPANVHGAFRVPARMHIRLRGARVALIDDVVTTGSTAQAAAIALLDAQVLEVELWTLARVT